MQTQEAITLQLRNLGLKEGDLVMVHASLRKLGPIQGRAIGFIESILSAVSPKGTLLMVLGSKEGDVFDAHTSPSDPEMGVLAEVFRTYPGSQVSDHAAARFCALGPRAQELLKEPLLHDYYDRGCTLDRFTKLGGKVLRLGADQDSTTLTHLAENLAQVSPKKRARRRYVRKDIGEQWIEGIDDCLGIQEWPGGDYFSQILKDYLSEGHSSRGGVGNCQAELFDAQSFVPFAIQWMEKNLTRA